VKRFTTIFLIVSFIVFLSHYFLIGQAVYGDGRFYYSYARSLALQGNLDIKDELTHSFSPQGNNSNVPDTTEFTTYPVQSLGPALFWAPVLKIINSIAETINLAANGYSDIYQISIGLFSILLTSAAFYFLGKLLLNRFKPSTAFFTLLLVWSGTNLFFYTAIDNINTHFFSFSLAVFTLYQYLGKKKPSLLLTGLLAGLAFQNRQPDVLFHIALFLAFLVKDRKLTSIFLYTLSGLTAVTPQILVWLFQFGSVFPPMASQSFWRFTPLTFLSIIFDLPQGLLYTAPIMLLAIVAMPLITKDRYLKFGAISFVATLVITSFWWSPLGGASYGPRFLIIFYPLLSISLATLIEKLTTRKLLILTPLFILINLTHILHFLYISP